MDTARQLISTRVVTGSSVQRLSELGEKIRFVDAHHCVVLHEENGAFVGVVRLADIATYASAGSRILGDLVSSVQPLAVRESDPAVAVAALLERHELDEAVVLSEAGGYLGLVTMETVLRWSREELRRVLVRLRFEEESASTARESLREAMSAKNNFFSILSHELRTPLNPLLLIASQRACEQGLPQEVRRDFEFIADQARAEARLVDDLLELSRLNRGKLTLEVAKVPLNASVAEALTRMRPQMEKQQLDVEQVWSAANPQVRADPTRLQQVFGNVLRHAVKFSTSGSRLRVETVSTSDASAVEIIFSNLGSTLTPAEIEKIFDPFQSSSTARVGTSDSDSGMDLGLILAKDLAQLHGGSVVAETHTSGTGLVYRIKLPAMDSVTRRRGDSSSQIGTAKSARPILLVEDHDSSRSALKIILEQRKYSTVTAKSAEEALEIAANREIELVISDLWLPDKSGFEMMALLRDRYGIRGIAVSGYGSPQDRARSKAAGFQFHLTKPIDVGTLEAALMAMLGQPESAE
ncbi:MAG: multi-sensor hybrid histidine kinase [Verrucomicrobia bacterium]|nr:multi-sensor hybrid histidine kinase [Verrucomicrobiota bacterium]